MSTVWKTKFGSRRVRQEEPTLSEAIAAAQGMADDVQDQVEIAASLMALPVDQVRPHVLKASTPRRTQTTVAFASRPGGPRAVIVERRPSRRPLARAH